MSDGQSKAPVIAIGAAVVALATSIGAVVMLVVRDKPAAVAAPVAAGSAEAGSASSGSGSAATPAAGAVIDVSIAAADVLKLKQRELVEDATDGVAISDEALRAALKLQPDDVITAIGGRTVTREYEIYDAMMGLTMSETTAVYVDVMRDSKPVLLRWKLDVSMRSAWRTSLNLSSSPYGNPSGSYPSQTIDLDQDVVDAIEKIDDTHVRAPRAAVDAMFAFTTKGARMVPSMTNGSPNGVKLYAIRPTSVYSKLGFTNGDTIVTINGQVTPTLDKGIEVYKAVKTATKLEVGIVRRGSPLVLSIDVK